MYNRSMKEFFAILKRSIYSPEFYRGIPQRPFSYGVRYFYAVVLLISLCMTIVFSVGFFSAARLFLHDARASIIAMVPADLVMTIKRGVVEINQPQPYFIPLADDLKSTAFSSSEHVPNNVLVVDTEHPFSFDSFRQYDTLFLVAQDGFAYPNRGGVALQPLSLLPDVTLSRDTTATFFDTIQRVLKWLAPLLVFIVLCALIFFMSFTWLYLFFGALIVWAVASIKKVRLSYMQAYHIALYAVTPALILGVVLAFVPHIRIPLPLLLTIVIAVEAWINVVPPTEHHDALPGASATSA